MGILGIKLIMIMMINLKTMKRGEGHRKLKQIRKSAKRTKRKRRRVQMGLMKPLIISCLEIGIISSYLTHHSSTSLEPVCKPYKLKV